LFSQEIEYKWTEPELKKANTARFAFYMKKEGRRAVLFLNLARINPEKFLYINAIPYFESHGLAMDYYTKTLVELLKKLKPREVLRPSFNAHLSAKMHARKSGKDGSTGHKNFEKRMKLTLNFSRVQAECCDYGSDANKGEDIVLHLLIDRGVPSLGHRKILIDKDFRRVGVSIKPHIKYGYNSVLDFK